MKRQQQMITPTQALTEIVGEKHDEARKEIKRVDRKRVSFDLRIDLHKELKMQSLIQEKSIYILIEEALDIYLKETRK